MRCLRCGKDLPLLKRLSGGEFCSDAHRREYHQEYSELALSRLLQALPQNPPPGEALPGLTPPVQTIDPLPITAPEKIAPEKLTVAATQPVAQKPAPTMAASAIQQPPIPVPTPSRVEEKAPAAMAGKLIHQPAASTPPAAVMAVPECETLVASVKPMWPSREVALAATGLFRAVPMACWDHWEIQKSVAHPVDARVEWRSMVRPASAMHFDLHIGGPRDWTLASQTVEAPAVGSSSPDDATLWQAPPRDFAPPAIAFDDLVSSPLPLVEPEIPAPAAAAGEPAISAEPRQPVPANLSPAVSLPAILEEVAREKAPPAQVFTAWLPHNNTPQITRPETLPLRPVMVLAPAERKIAPSTVSPGVSLSSIGASRVGPSRVESRRTQSPEPLVAKPELPRVLSPSALSPSITAPRTEPPRAESPRIELPPMAVPEPIDLPAPIPALAAPPPPRADLGLPEFRAADPAVAIARRMWMMVVVVAGILILVVSIFLFTSTKADSTPRPLTPSGAHYRARDPRNFHAAREEIGEAVWRKTAHNKFSLSMTT
jgi:hypothetical protein